MPEDTDKKLRKRMVVEEVVGDSSATIESTPKEVVEIKDPDPKKETESKKEEVRNEVVRSDKTQKPSNVILWILIPGVFLLGAVLGGIVFYQKGVSNKSNATTAPMETNSIVASPSPTPAATTTVDLSKFPVSILNGSGIAGEAGKVKAILEAAGFTVSSTGNASAYNFTKTVIKVKADVDAQFVTKLSDTLSKTYLLDKNATLPTTSKDEVQIVVGSSKAQ